MPLINCEICLQLKWSKNCILLAGNAANQNLEFKLKQLESGFKRTINWNKYLPKAENQAQNRYLDFLIDPNFQGVNRLFFGHLKMMMIKKVTSNIIFQLWK